MNKIAVVLPARLASTRLPQKLLLDKTGKPLLEHTLEKALEAQRMAPDIISKVIVAADDEKLMIIGRNKGVESILTRLDHNSGTERIAEVAEKLEEDIIINLQADEPEMDPSYIVIVGKLLMNNHHKMATVAVPIYDKTTFNKPSIVKVVLNNNKEAIYFSRAPIPYARDGTMMYNDQPIYGFQHVGLYAYRKDFLLNYNKIPKTQLENIERLEQLRVLDAGYKILVDIVPNNQSGIDTQEDYDAFLSRNQIII
jgi:3-deoxy-manno-octulosonate cytidylyltransferase (CMP-KDO synthetase)